MSRDQEHRAINNALLALGNGLATEPIQRGFKNNLGVIGAGDESSTLGL